MKRSSISLFLGAAFAVAAFGLATRAPAQVPAPWPSSFPMATPSPGEAVTGTITGSQPFAAQLQTAGGSVTLKLHPGTVILNPSLEGYGAVFLGTYFKGLAAGQRVYVLGFPQGDGTLRADEIDVVPARP